MKHADSGLLELVTPWQREEPEELLRTRLFTVFQHQARSSTDPRKLGRFVHLESADWVNVIAFTPSKEIVLVEQYRHGTSEITLEIPGGMVDPGESPLTAALRELREESGHEGRDPRLIGSVTPNPAILNNRCHTALVIDARPVAAPNPDHNEELGVRLASLVQIAEWTRSGIIHHALVLAAFHHLNLLLPPTRCGGPDATRS